MADEQAELLKGTLDLLVLRTLSLAPLHGYGVAQRIEQLTAGAFRIQGGSLFPALYRLEREGYLRPEWRKTDTGRRAKYYSLTRAGKRKLGEATRSWEHASAGITRLLEAT